ncbi:MAG TPA: hypothetical protein VMG34_02490 [Bacteroidota bacterium]|nr:hypothetical protein [Bacteroidota bacterium]
MVKRVSAIKTFAKLPKNGTKVNEPMRRARVALATGGMEMR